MVLAKFYRDGAVDLEMIGNKKKKRKVFTMIGS
jgi:hypothetical protein